MALLDEPEGRALAELYVKTVDHNYELLRALAEYLADHGTGTDVVRLRAQLDQYEAALAALRSCTKTFTV
ncbi:hypothetical protein [Actinoplanes sp. NPDC026670]|uniref:hypothetical protein n=1 Tax=Actinoplanes sp. NPDC026670 TaxID=3154700 RepID=UPI0033DCAD6D